MLEEQASRFVRAALQVREDAVKTAIKVLLPSAEPNTIPLSLLFAEKVSFAMFVA